MKCNIEGMTCSACSARIEKSVSKLDGVESVAVNLLTNTMDVHIDENNNDIKTEIFNTVTKLGYGIEEIEDSKISRKSSDSQLSKDSREHDKEKHIVWRLIISFAFLIPLMYLSMHHMLNEWFSIPVPEFITRYFHGPYNGTAFGFTQFLLVLPIVYVNRAYFSSGFKNMINLHPNMDSLIALGSTSSIVYGIYVIYKMIYGLKNNDLTSVDAYTMDLYFESAGTILTLITLGKYLEYRAKKKTKEAVTGLMKLRPNIAYKYVDGKEIKVSIEDVNVNDLLIVKAGNIVPVDGVIIEGNSNVDESMLTGESMPVSKHEGDSITGGTSNINGVIVIKATKIGEDTALANIIKLVVEASGSKAPIAKLADRISLYFVPIVIVIALITFITWLALGNSFEFALSTGISVLVISCPCALGLATPVAIMAGSGRGASMGVLIKSGDALELAGKTSTIVFDKTGTITQGKPSVVVIKKMCDTIDEASFNSIMASLERFSEHPLALAVNAYAKEGNVEIKNVSDFKEHSGNGVSGIIDKVRYFAGNIEYMKKLNVWSDDDHITSVYNDIAKDGSTPVILANDSRIMGMIGIKDRIKSSSRRAIKQLRDMGIDTIMLTGDNEITASVIGKEAGINKVYAGVLPGDKAQKVEKLKSEGKVVAMVGDGINDAPALVSADIGIAVGTGMDIAVDSADIVLMKNDLLDVVTAIKLSKATIKNIKENLFWAFFYNCLGIPLAAGILFIPFGIKLNPMIAAAAMSFSSVFVVLNALRLRLFKKEKDYDKITQTVLSDKKQENITQTELIKKENKSMITVYIDGMMCAHCSGAVAKALEALEGVNSVRVDLEGKKAIVEGDITDEIIKEAVVGAGYEVNKIER